MTKRVEPQCVEATVSSSVGGKIQLVEYGKLSNSFNYSINRRYTIPEDWSEEDVERFQLEKLIEFREKLEPIAQAEQDDLLGQSDWYKE